jgi:DNA invertase Pin-like site-specific DNA recombinase
MRHTDTTGQPLRAGVYVRLSKWEPTAADGDSSAMTRQEPDCRDLATRRGWVVANTYVDEDRSAFSGARRPDYERMLDDIKNDQLDVVVVQHPDRLHRHPRELEDFVDLLERTGVCVASCTAGDVDLETPEGRLVARITGAVARKDSEDKSRRLRRMMVELVDNGKPNGGGRPYGYQRTGAKTPEADTRKMVLDPVEAPIARDIIERVAAGESLTAIMRDLNTRGIPNARGNTWNLNNIRKLALNGRYAKVRMHNGREAGRGDWPAVVDEGTWRRAVALLTDESRRRRRTPRVALLVGGLIVCGKCGRPLTSKQHWYGRKDSGRMVRVYACRVNADPRLRGCGGVTVKAEPVEDLVTDAVIAAIEAPAFAKALQRKASGTPKAVTDAKAIEDRLERFEQMAVNGDITPVEWKRMRDGLLAKLSDAHAQMTVDTAASAAGRYAGQAGALRADWPNLALDRRQAIVRSVVEAVVVAPINGASGGVFDPSRVSIKWRS